MVIIKIEKPHSESGTGLEDAQFSFAVEDVIGDYATVLSGPYEQNGGLNGLQRGVLGLEIYVFGTNKQGIIEYKRFITAGGYFAHVELKGFSEEDPNFRNIKKRLEAIAAANDPAPFLEGVEQHKNIRILRQQAEFEELEKDLKGIRLI